MDPHQSHDPMHGVRRSLDGNVRFSQNPMRFSHSGREASFSDDPIKNARSPPSAQDRGGHWTPRWLMHLLPRSYFHFPYEHKSPVAPPRLALTIFVLELLTVAAVFAAMCYYFRTTPTPKITITLTPLPGQTCSVLNPKKDTTFYSAEHSENAQFASPYMTSTECVSLLTRLDVCGDGRRLDHVTLLGVSNPNTTHYYSGGQGYLSFTPTQTPGLATQLVPIYNSSISFPKPDISRPAFLGSDSNWYLFNFARNTALDAFSSFRGVPASTFLYDARTNIVYNPAPTERFANGDADLTMQQRDYDLSSSSPNVNMIDVVGTLRNVTGWFDIGNIGVNAGEYYGLRGAPTYFFPYGVAVDSAGNVFVTDTGNHLIRRIDAKTQDVTNLGTSASPPFSSPLGVAVDAESNVYVTDSGNKLVRRIDAMTQAVTNLGTSASPAFDSPHGVAVDAEGNVFVVDTGHNLVRRIDAATQAVTNLGTSASPAFNEPYGMAVDAAGNLFIADKGNNLVRKIDAETQAVTSLGTSASPAFSGPTGVAVDAAGNVFVTDELKRVRMIDAKTQAVTSVGTSASPAFSSPLGVAVDAEGNVTVADTFNCLLRRIDAKTQTVARYLGAARVLSWDMQNNPDPSSFTLWPDMALAATTGNAYKITVVDSVQGGCQDIVTGADGRCFVLVHAEVSAVDGRLYLEFNLYYQNNFFSTQVRILNPTEPQKPATVISFYGRWTTSRLLWGVFNTQANGIVLLTSDGAAMDMPDENANRIYVSTSLFTKLVTAAGTSIVDASAIPSKTPGEPARFLLLTLKEKGLNTMYTYDAFTDTIASSNAAAAATTHAMLAFTWGVCDGSVTRGLVELSFSNAYSNKCPLPKTGLYYQSPNVYYAIPFACLGVAYDKLLTDCPEIRANMKALVDASCPASIAKVCRQQYDLNPPFSCVTDVYPSALTVISLSGSNAMAVSTLLALVVAALLARAHRHYRPSEQDIAMVNTPSRNHSNANADETKSGRQSFSGPRQGQGIEMLPPHGASMQEMQGAHKRMEAENAQLRELVHSLSMTQQQQQHELKLLQQQQQPPMHHQQQYQQQLPPSAATTQNMRASLLLDVPPLPTSVPHLSSPSPYQVMPPFNMAPPIPPQRRPSQQQRPSWSAETASFDEGQRDGSGRL